MGKASFIPLLLMLLVVSTPALLAVRDGPSAAPAKTQLANASKQYLDAHNQARAEVGVGPLSWSDALAKSASLTVKFQRDRQGCAFANLTNIKFGANQFWVGDLEVTPRSAVEAWVAEKAFYNYANNTCAPRHSCGVYTQVVWKNSVELGCARAQCAKEDSSLIICFYNPPGNYAGERPY